MRFVLSSSILAMAAALLMPCAVLAQDHQRGYSDAEELVFMSEHLANVAPPMTLGYSFRRHGTLQPVFDDRVSLALSASATGGCCNGSADFLSAERRTILPEVENARANPVVLYFLEHDVRDMSRLTKGQPNHFRKRIRMAIYNAARVDDTTVRYRGQPVAARRVLISPYDDDPNRARFAQYADKAYMFWLSAAVPGGVYGVATRMRNGDAAPLIVEEMFIDGATPPDVAALTE